MIPVTSYKYEVYKNKTNKNVLSSLWRKWKFDSVIKEELNKRKNMHKCGWADSNIISRLTFFILALNTIYFQ